jgi:hypothetical protein
MVFGLRRPRSRSQAPSQRVRLRLEYLEGRTLPSGTGAWEVPVGDVGPAQTVLSAAQRAALHMSIFGDGTLGIVRSGAGYIFFGAGNSGQEGTQRLTAGALDPSHDPLLAPSDVSASGVPLPALSPDPQGDFDRNYAGGGPTYRITAADGQVALLQVYHGENHYRGTGLPFYASLGMAISRDGGRTFRRIGEFIQPADTLAEAAATGSSQDVGSGPLVEADQFGRPVTSSTNPSDSYYYTIFTDTDPKAARPYNITPSFAIARAKKSDVIEAAFRGAVADWKKFYLGDDPAPRPGVDYFTEPGVGGRFTSILRRDRGGAIAFPSVAYDYYLGRFVLAYGYGKRQILLRVSTGDLLHWGPAQVVASPGGDAADAIYPTLVGEGSDPARLGQRFWLYSVEGSHFPDWRQQALVAREITFSAPSKASPGMPSTGKPAAPASVGPGPLQLTIPASVAPASATGATGTVVSPAGSPTPENLANGHAPAPEAVSPFRVGSHIPANETPGDFLYVSAPSSAVGATNATGATATVVGPAGSPTPDNLGNGHAPAPEAVSPFGVSPHIPANETPGDFLYASAPSSAIAATNASPRADTILDLSTDATGAPAASFAGLLSPLFSYFGLQLISVTAPEPPALPLAAIWDKPEHPVAGVIDYAGATRVLAPAQISIRMLDMSWLLALADMNNQGSIPDVDDQALVHRKRTAK